MNTYAYSSQHERLIAGAGAFGMHLLFIALLVFGVNWQKKVEPQANIVDLWTNLPPQAKPQLEPPLPPPPQPVAPPKIEPTPPKAVMKPEVLKPDIALKEKSEKAEKERRLVEQKKMEEKKKRVEEDKLAKQQQAKEAELQRLAKEQDDAKRKEAQQAASMRQAEINKYTAAIRDKIKRYIVVPPSIQGNPEAEFNVVLLQNGYLMGGGTTLKRSSGNAAYDRAVEAAIARAQPLPLPPDPALFNDFRELNLRFKPQE